MTAPKETIELRVGKTPIQDGFFLAQRIENLRVESRSKAGKFRLSDAIAYRNKGAEEVMTVYRGTEIARWVKLEKLREWNNNRILKVVFGDGKEQGEVGPQAPPLPS